MNFWDASAIVALLVHQTGSEEVVSLHESDGDMVVWWGTQLECTSAIARLQREKVLDLRQARLAREDLAKLGELWAEVEPTIAVRERAVALIDRYPMKAADALQLAAAMAAMRRSSISRSTVNEPIAFVSLDRQLASAARAEGLTVVPT